MDITGKAIQGLESGEARNGIDHSVHPATVSAHNTVDKLADAARPAVDRLASTAHQTVDKFASVASTAAETLQEKKVQMNTMGAELIGDCRNYVRTNPLASIGIAAFAGFILSRLFSSR